MREYIQIKNHKIGEGYPCFIIAEAGSNHNGDFDQALKLIDVATNARADAVKFQTFKASRMYSKKAGKSDYLKIEKPIYNIIEDMEMPEEWIPQLADYCLKKGIVFLSSPFDEKSADLLEPYVPIYKIASYELTHFPLLKHIAKKSKPIILSTGTADIGEIRKAVEVITNEGNKQLVLMQCTACYPTPLSSVNIKSIIAMKKEFNIPVGLSDHSREYDVAPMAAVALGADCIEKHFTLSNSLSGPDHKFAIEPDELKNMVKKIRLVEESLGEESKRMLSIENELHSFARRSIFASREIKKGEKVTIENSAILRKGVLQGSLEPENYEEILGGCVNKRIEEGDLIQKDDFL